MGTVKVASAESTIKKTISKISIRKGSRVGPILALLFSAALFITYALPTNNIELGKLLQMDTTTEPTSKEVLERAKFVFKQYAPDDETGKKASKIREELWTKVGGSYWKYAEKVFRPLMKNYIKQLGSDFVGITKTSFTTVFTLALYSIVPGLAGLFYRRSFMTWFLLSFGLLFAINLSGKFGNLTQADAMPESGRILIFILSQIVLLVLAARLRRHVQRARYFVPKEVYNWGLTAALVVIGYVIWLYWDTEFLALGSETATARTELSDLLSKGLTGFIYKYELLLIGLPLVYLLFRNSSAWASRNGKNIVICLDGTSNTPDQVEKGFAAQTNVYKLFKMLKTDDKGAFEPYGRFDASLCKTYDGRQIGFYYAGVGNKYDSAGALQVLGMATGMGAADIVERAYLDLARVCQPRDRVFITGFSRGAAIARLLARAIDARGAPRSIWTMRLFGKHRTLWMSSRKIPVKVDVLGCWDTVGAFGVAKTIAGINFQQLNAFKDLSVPEAVKKAYHMVALDEQRDSFEPTLMDPDPTQPERIVEVWFPGDHANIGGGWATDSLSDITLDFLLRHISSGYAKEKEEAPGNEDWGVLLIAKKCPKSDVTQRKEREAADDLDKAKAVDAMAVDPDPRGQVRQWFSSLYEYRPRTLPLHAVISESVFERMTLVKPAYAPESLSKLNLALDVHRDRIVADAQKFKETESLSDEERETLLTANRSLRLLRWLSYWEDIKKRVQRQDRVLEGVEKVLNNSELFDEKETNRAI